MSQMCSYTYQWFDQNSKHWSHLHSGREAGLTGSEAIVFCSLQQKGFVFLYPGYDPVHS